MSVILLDEAAAPGGQVYRAPPAGLSVSPDKRSADDDAGDALRRQVATSAVEWHGSARVWSISGHFRVDAVTSSGNASFTAPRLVAATGAHERLVPFPGWTLPGVIGLAAATILLKSQGIVPGRRTVVAGCGPLLAAVAAKIVAGGGSVAAVVDLTGPGDWLRALPGMASRPDLLKQGFGWVLKLGMARVPVLFRHTVTAVTGADACERVTVAPVDAEGRLTGGRYTNVRRRRVGHRAGAGAWRGDYEAVACASRFQPRGRRLDPVARRLRPLFDRGAICGR